MAAAELLQLLSKPKDSSKQWFKKSDDSDEDTDSSNESGHEELMKNIQLLDKKNQKTKRYKGHLRSESSQKVSEFHLKSGGDDGKINLEDLVASLQTSSYHSKLKKTLESMQKMGKTVDVPLEKPTAQKIQRVVAYEETSKDISKWEPTVQKNRQAEHLSFPLEPYKPTAMSTGTLVTNFKPRTPLEKEIANVLQSNSQMLERNNKELSQEEEEALKTMSLEEALERRKELQKLRVLQSYYEQKCRRMKKIKSKKYHRIKRKAEKRSASKHTFEELQKENPELAKIELEKAEKLRVAERMSLKHRNTSKWAKNIIAKGIKDVQTRQALAEQLRISRQLTETKTAQSDSDDTAEDNSTKNASENTANIRNFGLVGDNVENPWLLSDGNTVTPDQEEDRGGEDKGDERIRKLQPITAKDTKQDEGSDESDGERKSKDSEEDEMFELMDENEVKKNAKKGRKLKGKKMAEKKKEKGKSKGMGEKGKKMEDEDSTKRETDEISEGRMKKKRKRSKMGKAEEKVDVILEDKNNMECKTLKKTSESKTKKKGKRSKMEKVEEKVDVVLEDKNNMECKTLKKTSESKTKKKGKISKMEKVDEKEDVILEDKNNMECKTLKKTSESKTKKKCKRSKMEKVEEKEDVIMEDKGEDESLLIENDGSEIVELGFEKEKDKSEKIQPSTNASKVSVNLNPKNVFQIEDVGHPSRLLDYTNDDEVHVQRMTIQEAFANDDVIEEFVKEKADAVETGKPKDLDTSLPGWGDWGGPGVDETKRKRKFVVPAKAAQSRKDAKLPHVIINDGKDEKFTKNQVATLPYPYTSRDQWERSIRTPLGKHWNTASVHHKLVKPRVTTLPGTIIEPIKPTKEIQRSRVEDNNAEHGKKRKMKRMDSGIIIHA